MCYELGLTEPLNAHLFGWVGGEVIPDPQRGGDLGACALCALPTIPTIPTVQ